MAGRADSGGVDHEREALLGVLVGHGVEFVLIGGAAIQSHGRRYDTLDIDVAPNTTDENLDRLAGALNGLECRLITDPANPGSWVAVPSDYFTPRSLRSASVWNLATSHGQLDLCFAPSGFPGGYRDLAPRAADRPVAGTTIVVSVASIDDIHASKREANRAKDRVYLEQLPEQDA